MSSGEQQRSDLKVYRKDENLLDKNGTDDPKDDEDFMNMIYIALGVLGFALILFVVLYLLKRKLCPEKEPDEAKNEIEVASPQ